MLLSALALSTAGCETARTECAGWRQIMPSVADTLTRGTQEQIIAHNLHGERQGCW